MDKDVSLSQRLVNKIGCSIEMKTKIVFLMVFPWDVESERYFFLGVTNVNVLAGSENGSNFMFCLR